MSTLSATLSSITAGGPDGWDLHRRAMRMIAAGEPVIPLSIGEHDIRTDPAILAAMDAAARGGRTGYAEIAGTPALRAEIAARVQAQSGVVTTPANVIVMPGGQAGLFAAHRAACDPGDVALYVDPYYATYPGTIRAVGAQPRSVIAAAEAGFQPAEDDLRQAAQAGASQGRTRSLLINSPNNPTGALYSRATLEGIARVCREADLWLISDEVYDTQVWEGAHLSPRALPGMAERTLVVGSLSKSHAMTGSRVGWIVGPEAAIAALDALATHTTYGIPGYIQDAALFALQQGAGFEAGIAEPFRRRRAIVERVLARTTSVRAAPMRGAMYAMLDIRATGLSGEAFGRRLLDEERIAVMPGESFGTAGAGHVRVALTVDDARLDEALSRLVALAERLAAPA